MAETQYTRSQYRLKLPVPRDGDVSDTVENRKTTLVSRYSNSSRVRNGFERGHTDRSPRQVEEVRILIAHYACEDRSFMYRSSFSPEVDTGE